MPSNPNEVFHTLHAEVLHGFPDLVIALNGDPAGLLRHAGVIPGAEAAYRKAIHLLELAAAELACGDFGLRLAQLQGDARVFGPLRSSSRSV